MSFRSLSRQMGASIFAGCIFCLLIASADAQLVPGTGKKLATVGDDFEDPEWRFIGNHNVDDLVVVHSCRHKLPEWVGTPPVSIVANRPFGNKSFARTKSQELKPGGECVKE